ncbi:hypothetical protein NMY22_g19534 [Coprinellus aureogranulatus]|nr:hypothetical protein NMY22_g19534 [Coprinellus aureogranulatus]
MRARSALVLYDEETQRVWAACVGKPVDPTWDPACQAAALVIRAIGEKELFASRELAHKRGKFPVINAGILWGGGPQKPYNLLNRSHADALAKLFRDLNINRLATFQSSSLAFFAPRLYQYQHQHIQSLLKHDPTLVPNFRRSAFSACAFNFGPQVVTFPHTDCMNLAFGWCAVTALGDFDYRKGGHLALVEAQMVIEFPPGTTILLPSATVTHANTPVQPGETRLSFTQYVSGALFRYVDNGFRTKATFEKEDPEGYAAMMEENAARWKMGLGLWDTLEELLARANSEREEGELDSDEDEA